MNFKNTEIVPATVEEDENRGASHWHEGKYAWLDEGTHVTFYIGHQTENTEDGVVTRAYPIRVAKPVSRDMAINFAEMDCAMLWRWQVSTHLLPESIAPMGLTQRFENMMNS